MIKLTGYIKTNISKAFFSDSGDEDDFYYWVNDELHSAKLTDIVVEVPVEGIEGISKVTVTMNEFNSDHELDLIVKVETSLSEDEIEDNDALFDFMETDVIPKFISEFNSACDLSFPTTTKENFDDMIFDGENFYTRVAIVSGTPDSTKLTVLQATDDFEVYL